MLELEGEGWRSAYFRPNFQALEHYFGRNLQHFSDHSVLSNDQKKERTFVATFNIFQNTRVLSDDQKKDLVPGDMLNRELKNTETLPLYCTSKIRCRRDHHHKQFNQNNDLTMKDAHNTYPNREEEGFAKCISNQLNSSLKRSHASLSSWNPGNSQSKCSSPIPGTSRTSLSLTFGRKKSNEASGRHYNVNLAPCAVDGDGEVSCPEKSFSTQHKAE